MARSLVFITFFYVLGIVLGRFCFSVAVSICLLIGALVWVSFNLFFRREARQAFIPILVLFLAAGSLALNLSLQKAVGNIRAFSGERCTVMGMVEDEPLWRDDDVVFPLRPEKVILQGEEHPVSGTVRVVLRLDPKWGSGADGSEGGRDKVFPVLSYGQKISLEGMLYEPQARRNPGGFAYRSFLETQGMAAAFYGQASDLSSLGVSPELSRFRRTALQVKEKMTGVLKAYLPQREGSLLVGMLFGERRTLDPDTERIFRASGVSHLLAVSGLHVGLIAAFIIYVAQRAGFRGWQAFLFSALFLFAYIYICGCQPATLRAFVMILMAMGAVQLGRSNDLPTALAASALVILVYNPLLLFTVGFQLSYAATFSLITFTPVLTEKISLLFSRTVAFLSPARIKSISSLAAVTLAAQLGVIPFTAFYFREISLIALFSNMLILPVMSAVLSVGLAAALLGLLIPPAGSLLNLANYPLLAYILLIAGEMGSLPFAYRVVYPPRIFEMILYYLLLLLLGGGWRLLPPLITRVRQRSRPFHFLVLLLVLALILTWSGLPGKAADQLEIVFLDVGQGDAIFIHTPGGQNILIDGGGYPVYRGDIDAPGRYVVVPFLEYRRIKKLDLVVISHPHEDHYGGLLAVLDKFPVEMLVTNADLTESSAYRELLALAETKNISREIVEKGDTIRLGNGINIDVLGPPTELFSGATSDANNNSLVLYLRYRKAGALFTGDIEAEAVNYLLKEGLLPECRLLKAPHHGGYLDNLRELLECVSPHIVVISVGNNSFGHPHPDVLSTLQEYNVHLYRTDLHGAVTIKTDGNNFERHTVLFSPAYTIQDNLYLYLLSCRRTQPGKYSGLSCAKAVRNRLRLFQAGNK